MQSHTAVSLALLAALTLAPAPLAAQNQPSRQDPPARSRGLLPAPEDYSTTDIWNQRKDYALLFATDEYDTWQPLANPISDAQAIAQELQDTYGFASELVLNPTRERIVAKLRQYSKKRFGPGDQLFIFFAGHGLFDDVFRQGFIVARDSRIEDETRGTYESYDDLRTIIDSMPAKHILLVMDACYSGTFDPKLAETRGRDSYANFTLPELFAKTVTKPTRMYLTSGGRDYVPDGAPGHHSPFAAHLLTALRTYGGKQGYLTFSNILSSVESTRPHPQWGAWGGNEPGSEFLFINKHLTAELNKPKQSNSPATPESQAGETEHTGADSRKSDARPSIAVLGFKNISGRPEDAWLSTALSEWLSTELAAGGNLRVVTSEDVARAKADLAIQDSSGFATDTSSKIYKLLGPDYVVSGSYLELPGASENLRVDFRLQRALTGEMLSQVGETGNAAALAELIKTSAAGLFKSLGLPAPSRIEASAATSGLPVPSDAARLYAEGLSKLRSYDLLSARDLLQRAIASDPNSPFIHQSLARAWSELGYDTKAKEEAADAMDRARNLPPEKRLAIEGAFREMTSEWDRAIEIYRSLWTIFPDEPDYALDLARSQIAAGQGQDALATLVKLRALTKDRDPRVDLEEAIAAGSLSDAKRAKEAAANGIQGATKLGARLLAAQAYWQECSALQALGDQDGAQAACHDANQFSDLAGGQQVKARSLTVLASIMESQGKNSEAMELRQEALRIARQIGSQKDIIGALLNLAILESSQGQAEDAKRDIEEATHAAEETGDKAQLVWLHNNWGNTLYAAGDYEGARAMYQRALDSAAETGDKTAIANALQNVALVLFQLGDLEAATKDVERAIGIARESALSSVEAASLGMLGDLLMAKGNIPGAQTAYQSTLNLFVKIGDQSNIAATRLSFANLLLENGSAAQAEKQARDAVDEFEKEKAVDMEVSARETLARALMAQRKITDALAEVQTAEKLSPQDRGIRISLAITAAKLKARTGNLADARDSIENALGEAKRMKLLGSQLEIRLAAAEIEIASGSPHPESLALLLADARRSGYLLIAAKAAKLQQ